ncbi:MAG TPA: flippase activity-associated protein Agl23 [Anaerolineaceae bacterium]
MEQSLTESHTPSWLDKPVIASIPRLTIENLLVGLIIVITIASRFIMLGERVMSHDEINHVVPSYDLFQGRGYRHDPVTHGPFQFHVVALSYFLLGDSDFSSRVPAALFSSAAVFFVLFAFRRYLGRTGALLAAIMFMISPYMVFYGRYTRNEAFIMLLGVVQIFSIFRYYDKRDPLSLYLLTGSVVLHFTVKETSYIYTAIMLLFLGFMFLDEIRQTRFNNPTNRTLFLSLAIIAVLLLGTALAIGVINAPKTGANPSADISGTAPAPNILATIFELVLVVLALIAGVTALILFGTDLGFARLKELPSFYMLALIGSLILPQLAAFPVKLVGWNPLDYSAQGMTRTAIFLILLGVISIAIGYWLNARVWLTHAILFYGIYTILYTTVFTNGQGFFTGIVGSLGYWLSQQGVERGSQPIYYFALIQIPIYEFLPAIGTLVAFYFGMRYNRFFHIPGFAPATQPELPGIVPSVPPNTERSSIPENLEMTVQHPDNPSAGDETIPEAKEPISPPIETKRSTQPIPVLLLLLFWSITSLTAFSIAGEKMPWLTVHITLPFILAAGWGFGFLVDTTPWKRIANRTGAITLVASVVFLFAASATLGSLLGNQPPFQGKTLEQLGATSAFIFALISAIGSGALVFYLLKDWQGIQIVRLVSVVLFAILAVLTARASYRASFINYDSATEYLVYAHAARGPKDILAQVEEISRRMTRGKDIAVAHDNDALYPYWWYFRDYPNKKWITDKPTRELRDSPIIIVGEDNFAKIEPIVGKNYVYFEYMRLWWPNQDYWNLTWNRLWGAISDPKMRSAIFQIWLNRDFRLYGEITKNPSVRAETWQPGARLRMYIRRDVIGMIWNYGASPTPSGESTVTDPYEAGMIKIQPDRVIGQQGSEPGKLLKPRGIAVAPDGSLYVADSDNHRIQHFSAEGNLLHTWGVYVDLNAKEKPAGSMNQPWGVVVGKNGTVYVTDTWNHRIQAFTAEGKFIRTWGYFGQAEKPEAFWGPRGLAADPDGRIYVTDTGNKRVVIFDADGNYVTQFGTVGIDPGQFDEPVGIAVDPITRTVYVADTWNQRIQVFTPDTNGLNYTFSLIWEINGWFGQSLDNKPFLALGPGNTLFVTDPEGYRVLEFTTQGKFLRGWGEYKEDTTGFGLASAVAVDPNGAVWVSDAGNHRILRFTLPNP